MLSMVALRLVSTVLGGYGIFFLSLSFDRPSFGGHAFVLLGAATAMVYFGPSERTRG
jgi:hypothetical protein